MSAPMFFTLALTTCAAAIDWKRREIPDWISLALLAVGVVACVFSLDSVPWPHRAIGALVGFGLGALAFYGGAFGGGDAKLAAGLGGALGLPTFVPVILFTAIAGGAFAWIGRRRREREVAYGPAFAIGLLVFLCVRYIERGGAP